MRRPPDSTQRWDNGGGIAKLASPNQEVAEKLKAIPVKHME